MKKNYFWSVITIALAIISIWAVASQTKNLSFEEFFNQIKSDDPLWIVAAIVCMLGYIFFEGHAIQILLKGFGYPKSIRKGLLYSSADIYFSAITPSATGGQPASALFMIKDGVPAGIATVTLLLNLIMYTVSIMVLGLVALIIRPNLFAVFEPLSKALIIVGYVVLTVLTLLIIMLIKRADIVEKIFNRIIEWLHRIKIIKKTKKLEDKMKKAMSDYESCADMIEGHVGMLIHAFFMNLIQRALQLLVPACIFMATGGSAVGAFNVWVTQIFVTMGSNYIPIPGAMGISDYLLIDGLKGFMSSDVAVNMDLLSRAVSFYGCVLLSLIVVVIGFVRMRKNKAFNEEEEC